MNPNATKQPVSSRILRFLVVLAMATDTALERFPYCCERKLEKNFVRQRPFFRLRCV